MSEKIFVQYHNLDSLGYLPGGYEWDDSIPITELDTSDIDLSTISTRKSVILGQEGSQVLLIVGWGSPKQYALWSLSTIIEIDRDDDMFDATCEGFVLNPPAALEGPEFNRFKKRVGNFGLGFQNITEDPFTETLVELAPKSVPDEDGTDTDDEEKDEDEEDSDPLSTIEEVTDVLEEQGDFDSLDTPAEELERRLCSIAVRRGQPRFRNKLIRAYRGRCAITGCDVVDALEAAHLTPLSKRANFSVRNGLLLRADIHTLFDLNLIGINPRTMKISLHPRLAGSSLRSLEGTLLELPLNEKDRPGRDHLQTRWEEFHRQFYPELQ